MKKLNKTLGGIKMAIQGFNIEEDNEEIRDEIEEGVNMYEEDKAIPAYDIKLTLDDLVA